MDPRVFSRATKRNRIAKWEQEITEGVSGVGPHQYFMIIIAEQVYNLFLISQEQIRYVGIYFFLYFCTAIEILSSVTSLYFIMESVDGKGNNLFIAYKDSLGYSVTWDMMAQTDMQIKYFILYCVSAPLVCLVLLQKMVVS